MNSSSNKRPPFVGHLPFHRLDQDLFFGRDSEIKEAQLRIQSHPLLLLSGRAGVGKTSFLNAGLIPFLEEEGFEVFKPAFIEKKTARHSSNTSSNIYISHVLSQWTNPEELTPAELPRETLSGFLDRQKLAKKNDTSLKLIIFENLEALFTSDPEYQKDQETQNTQKDREDFFHQVRDALASDPYLRVVFVIRKACMHQLTPFAELLPGKLKVRLELEALRPDAALAAMTFPLENRHITFEKGVAETLIKDLMMLKVGLDADEGTSVSGEWVEPTLLQIVGEHLWYDLPHDAAVITRNHRKAFANVDRALSLFYEKSLQGVCDQTGVKGETLRRWFEERLMTPSGTGARAYREGKEDVGLIEAAVVALEDAHLIRGGWLDSTRWLELSYERLIQPIMKANQDWRDRKDDGEQIHRDLENQAIEWVRLGRAENLLLVDDALAIAKRWISQSDIDRYGRSEVLRTFIGASLEKSDNGELKEVHENEVQTNEVHTEDESQKESPHMAFERVQKESRSTQRSRQKTLIIVLVFSTIALVAALLWQNAQKLTTASKIESQRTEQQNRVDAAREQEAFEIAEVSRLEIERAKSEALAAKEKAALERKRASEQEALAALERHRAEAQEALVALSATRVKEALASKKRAEAEKAAAIAAKKQALDRSSEAQTFLSRSLTTDAIKQLDIDPTLSVLLAMQALTIADFSNKSKIPEAEDVLYQAVHGLPLKSVLSVHAGAVNALVFGPNGKRLASAGEDGTSKIWNLLSGEEFRIFAHDSPVTSLSYRANGRQLATAGLDGQVKVWRISSGKHLFTVSHEAEAINSVAFSPNQRYLASAGEKGIAIVWDVKSEKQRYRLQGHRSSIHQIIFSPNGKNLGSAGEDGTVRIWDVKSGRSMLTLRGHEQPVNSIAFSPDNKWIASASKDGTVRVWSARFFGQGEVKHILFGHAGEVLSVAFSPDGRRIASAGDDGTVRLWNAQSGKELAILTGHDSATSLAFSPDGRILASGGRDKTLRLYSLEIKDMMSIIRKQLKRSLTPEECKQYLHTEKCPPGT